jgi:hypothetical protein
MYLNHIWNKRLTNFCRWLHWTIPLVHNGFLTPQMKHVRLNIHTNVFHAPNTTVKAEMSKSQTRHPNKNHYTHRVTLTTHRAGILRSSAHYNPPLTGWRWLVRWSIPESQYRNTFIRKRGFPAHKPNQPQPRIRHYYDNDMTSKRQSLHAFYRPALFLLAWPWVGRRMRKMGNKTLRLVELVGSRGSQPARSISWNTLAATTWTRCYMRNDSPVWGNKICVITWLRTGLEHNTPLWDKLRSE